MTTVSHSLYAEQVGDGLHDLISVHDRLLADFAQACAEFAQVRRHQQGKDTPAHRIAVLESRARIDAILDIYLELQHS
jgi:hypothetical protein